MSNLDRNGGDAARADRVVVAVPGGAIAEALGRVTGAAGKPTIDVTNSCSGPPDGLPSLAAHVKSIIGGPTVEAFNTNFALLYDRIADQRVQATRSPRPSTALRATAARPRCER